MNKMVKFRFNFGAVSIFLKVSHHVVLVGDSQNDKLKKENPDFRFYSLYPHVPLCNSEPLKALNGSTSILNEILALII